MSENIPAPVIELRLQPPRSYQQKRRLARRMRSRGAPEKDVKRVCWHPESSPTKSGGVITPTSQYANQMRGKS